MVIYICIKFQETISNSFQVIECTQIHYRNHYFQISKGHNSKCRLTRVTILCFCSFLKISRTVFNLQNGNEYMVEMAMFNVQRAITPKIDKPELRFMFSAGRLMGLYICVKFGENISDSIKSYGADMND